VGESDADVDVDGLLEVDGSVDALGEVLVGSDEASGPSSSLPEPAATATATTITMTSAPTSAGTRHERPGWLVGSVPVASSVMGPSVPRGPIAL
jgi:hypothetical protein